MKATKTTTVSIPKSLAEKIKKRLKETDFGSVESYVAHMVEKSLADVKNKEKDKVFSENEEQKVKERLKSLGYLD